MEALEEILSWIASRTSREQLLKFIANISATQDLDSFENLGNHLTLDEKKTIAESMLEAREIFFRPGISVAIKYASESKLRHALESTLPEILNKKQEMIPELLNIKLPFDIFEPLNSEILKLEPDTAYTAVLKLLSSRTEKEKAEFIRANIRRFNPEQAYTLLPYVLESMPPEESKDIVKTVLGKVSIEKIQQILPRLSNWPQEDMKEIEQLVIKKDVYLSFKNYLDQGDELAAALFLEEHPDHRSELLSIAESMQKHQIFTESVAPPDLSLEERLAKAFLAMGITKKVIRKLKDSVNKILESEIKKTIESLLKTPIIKERLYNFIQNAKSLAYGEISWDDYSAYVANAPSSTQSILLRLGKNLVEYAHSIKILNASQVTHFYNKYMGDDPFLHYINLPDEPDIQEARTLIDKIIQDDPLFSFIFFLDKKDSHGMNALADYCLRNPEFIPDIWSKICNMPIHLPVSYFLFSLSIAQTEDTASRTLYKKKFSELLLNESDDYFITNLFKLSCNENKIPLFQKIIELMGLRKAFYFFSDFRDSELSRPLKDRVEKEYPDTVKYLEQIKIFS